MKQLLNCAKDMYSSVFEITWNPPSLKINFNVSFVSGLLLGSCLDWLL